MRLPDELNTLHEAAPEGFAVRVLDRASVPAHRYDCYVRADSPVGHLYIAHGRGAVTGAAATSWYADGRAFEDAYRARTHRSVLSGLKPPPGLARALRGRDRTLRYDFGPLADEQATVLLATRTIPFGQLRPAAWLACEAGLPDLAPDVVLAAVRANPVPVLVPAHRLCQDDGLPVACGLPAGFEQALRAWEGVDDERVDRFVRAGARFLGSGTTRIFCYPTCAHARRITARHEVPFISASEAAAAGFRGCLSCRPATA
ncbi:Ada metal-binding domain-containing protein [Streptomyces laculatispora]|uniref:Ada metal-binding domain-containing protein n=1 Tax=Streptomyces laculatispora TaxID=887464 RepID=A0ABY9HVM5_9ACTN|nr:Ada metal-binding domain-containing protein [Streptomyces laculatispora]WLQ38601.1 Ada metal-binding domain-containing protein [Streptomyces laculatispora]